MIDSTDKNKQMTLDDVKKSIFNILLDFDDFCKEHNLHYSLAGGTLLGAVRHKGFIPWDDDIDVYMPRKDYDYLIKHYNKHGKTKKYKIVNSNNHGFYMMISKIIDTRTIAIEENRSEKIGVWIDILPVEYVSNEIPENVKKQLYRNSEELYFMGSNKYLGNSHFLKKIFKKIVRCYKKWRINSYYLRSISKYKGNTNVCFYSKRRQYVWSVLPHDLGIDNSTIRMEFEGNFFQVMTMWEEYLVLYFGKNYMELPPIDQRVSHELALRTTKF